MGRILLFKPTLKFAVPITGKVNQLIGYVQHGNVYLARPGMLQKVAWDKYNPGDTLTIYGVADYTPRWTCDALVGTVNPDVVIGLDIYIGIQSVADPKNIQGCSFRLKR